jgi:hypothetical protein
VEKANTHGTTETTGSVIARVSIASKWIRKRPRHRGAAKLHPVLIQAATLVGWTSRTLLEFAIGIASGFIATCGGEPSGTIQVRTEADAVVLIYRVRSLLAAEWKSIEQCVRITWTNCHFDGRRPWFVCSVRANGRHCGRRVAVLYGAGELFACRNCHQLANESQRALSRSPRSTIRPRSARPASADGVGSFTGPLVVGALVAFGLSTAGIFVAIALPARVAAATTAVVGRVKPA